MVDKDAYIMIDKTNKAIESTGQNDIKTMPENVPLKLILMVLMPLPYLINLKLNNLLNYHFALEMNTEN